MSPIKEIKKCEKHQWMSFAIDGSCIKCVSCGEIRMLSTNSTEIIKINENK